MDNENELIQVTTRLPLNVKEKIDDLAKSGGCSTAEIMRRSLDGTLSEYLGEVQYVDREQGEVIKKQLENYFKDLRKEWGIVNSTLGRGYSETIYRSKILANIMRTEGVYNAQLPKLNGKDEDIQLVFNNQTSQLPILGEVGLDVG